MKNTLKWRLSKLPTVDEITTLLEKKIITQEEAKEILFSNETVEERDKKSLEQEIKFLRETIEKLADRSKIAETIRVVEKPYYVYDWYRPYQGWITYSSGNGLVTQYSTTLTNASDTTCSGTTATNCVYISGTNELGDSTWSQFTPSTSFTDIKTF